MKISIAAILLVSCSLVLADATTTTTQRHLRGAEEEEAEQARHLQTIILAGGDSFLGQNGETCPIQDPDKTCPSVVDPVVCRGCRYENSCFASGAGFLIRRDCQVGAIFSSGDGFNDIRNCPQVPPTELCLALPNPLICGQAECEYGNACFAAQSGFDPRRDCRTVATPPPVDENFVNSALLSDCRQPDPSFFCPENAPVECGSEDCFYDNRCLAGSAGFDTSICRNINVAFDQSSCPVISFAGTFCPNTVNPTACGSQQCEYRNDCQAESAGFNPGSDCGDVPDPNPTSGPTEAPVGAPSEPAPTPPTAPAPVVCVVEECPNPLDQIAASDCGSGAVDPVTCKGCCTYDNLCLAAGANFNTQLECELRNPAGQTDAAAEEEMLPDLLPSECPPLSDRIPCTGESGGRNEVSCRGCIYGNRCRAAGAGFTQSMCFLTSTPSTPAPVAPTPPAPERTNFPTISPTPKQCPRAGGSFCFGASNEVICDGECTYTSQCAANSAGFDVGRCVTTASTQAFTCPAGSGASCFVPIQPVICKGGPDKDVECEYRSQCDAGRAAFSSLDCEVKEGDSAPAPAPGPSTSDFLSNFGGGNPTAPSGPTNPFTSGFQPTAPAPGPSAPSPFGGFSSDPSSSFGSLFGSPSGTSPTASNPFGSGGSFGAFSLP